ncbi:MAG TPA: thioredoxin family protein [Longimicrobiaceae bacterium]|nr:thioredoxin family protein [Longimicrobiaceae bacterium]
MLPMLRSRLVILAAALGVALAAAPARAQRLYDPTANAVAAVDSALALARVDHKRVLLEFGADWCLDCWVLDRLFHQPGVAPYLREHYHVVRVDVGQFDRNLKLVAKYGNAIEGGVPALVVLTPTGQRVVATSNGEVEAAHNLTPAAVLRMLQTWATATP